MDRSPGQEQNRAPHAERDSVVPAGITTTRWAAVPCSCGQRDALCRTRVLLRKYGLT